MLTKLQGHGVDLHGQNGQDGNCMAAEQQRYMH